MAIIKCSVTGQNSLYTGHDDLDIQEKKKNAWYIILKWKKNYIDIFIEIDVLEVHCH